MRYFTIFYYVYIYKYNILSQQRIFWVSISGAGQWHENARTEKPEQPWKVPGTWLQPSWKERCWKFVGTVLEPSWNLDLCWNPTVTMLELLVSRVGLVGRDSVLNLISVEWALLHVFPLWLRCLVVLLSPLCFWARRQVLEFHCFIFVLLFA